ncbi:MAG: T9SS type A sorting domain-containing protein [Bacteroidetes bacterium]|nr:T9SS type A sorting domain-containing protein [Bacteroidota bacterium]
MKAIITLVMFTVVSLFFTSGQLMNRDASTDLLKIEVEGGTQGFEDEAYIHFAEGATTAYDQAIDAIKWYSIDPEATMIWTVASDNTHLAINNLPLEDLHNNLNTIPMQFVCGYGGGAYLLTFSEFDTFDESVEIWLEDQVTGEGWLRLTPDNSDYAFNGNPDDPADRFNIHILDPTAITGAGEVSDLYEPIQVYSAGKTIYIKNVQPETTPGIQVCNMHGQQVQHTMHCTSQHIMKVSVNGPAGYYIIRLMADQHVYTKKIFLKNF